MKRSAIFAALFGFSITSVSAGSFDAIETDTVAPSAINWAGAYLGGFGSYEFGNTAIDDRTGWRSAAYQFINIPVDGPAAGVLGGYNWQRNNIVYGLEADFTFGGASGNSLVDKFYADETLEWKTNWSSTFRGRVGFSNNNWLFYGTAGIAFAQANIGYIQTNSYYGIIGDDFRQIQTFNGWSFGAGVEKKLGEHLVIRGEYSFSRFGEIVFPVGEISYPAPSGGGDLGYTPSFSTVRAAVIWSF